MKMRFLKILLVFSGIIVIFSMAISRDLSGTFVFKGDSDGGKPRENAVITITFSMGQVVLNAVQPGEVVTDTGIYRVNNDKITIRFNKMSFGCENAFFMYDGKNLSLPFKVLSDGAGYSFWEKAGSSSDKNDGKKGDKKGADDGKGKKGSKGGESGRSSGSSNSGVNSKGSSSAPVETFEELVGDWGGKAAGAEVRFRRRASFAGGQKFNVMTLTTKHAAEFFFHVFPDGSIKGEGTILYNLEPDLSGVDALAGMVKGLIGMMPMPSAPGGGALGSVADKMTSGMTSVPGVTSPSYSYKMKDAPQQRHFKIKGKVYREGNNWKIHLETTGDYYRSPTSKSPDNKLWVEWQVNYYRKESSFPCWSPFLRGSKGDAVVRKAAGGSIYIAESEVSGKHRNGVQVWQEYTFSWMARKVKWIMQRKRAQSCVPIHNADFVKKNIIQ